LAYLKITAPRQDRFLKPGVLASLRRRRRNSALNLTLASIAPPLARARQALYLWQRNFGIKFKRAVFAPPL